MMEVIGINHATLNLNIGLDTSKLEHHQSIASTGQAGYRRKGQKMEWYQKLKAARKERGLTLRQVAKMSGVSNPLISQIENGVNQNPGAFNLYKICHVYGTTVDDILRKIDSVPTCRGWEIESINGEWVYSDTKERCWGEKDRRPCKRCGKEPTKSGHDECLGKMEGIAAACCGHGVRLGWSTTSKSLGMKDSGINPPIS